jgi:hypothetical protein
MLTDWKILDGCKKSMLATRHTTLNIPLAFSFNHLYFNCLYFNGFYISTADFNVHIFHFLMRGGIARFAILHCSDSDPAKSFGFFRIRIRNTDPEKVSDSFGFVTLMRGGS